MAGSIVRPALDPQVVMSDSKYLRARQADGRIRRELEDFRRDPPPGITARPAEGSFRRVYATLQAPEGSPYEGGVFHLTYHYTRGYPNDPPKVRFTTKIFHPNINSKGEISLNILTSDGWSGRLDLAIVLLCIQSILDDPLAEDPLEAEIARLYMSDRVLYNATARDWTIKYAVDNDYCLDDGGTTRSAKRLFPAYLKWDALQEEFEVPFLRVILIGETGVGKTSLVSSLHDEAIPTGRADNSTIGTDINTFVIDRDSVNMSHSSQREGVLSERIARILMGTVIAQQRELAIRKFKRLFGGLSNTFYVSALFGVLIPGIVTNRYLPAFHDHRIAHIAAGAFSSIAGSTAGVLAGSNAGGIAGSIAGVLSGTTAGGIAGTMVGAIAGTMVGAIAGTMVGAIAGTMVG
eukprot:scpid75895/ scgid32540/ Ubiquitin-conjugating enzyme E2 2; Lethal protein 70; Ubiquitin carrier protein 2; Ubiquitin-protein ligase 2